MNAAHCTRAWQAEAIEDGRLAAADAASFARHAAGCTVCAAEARWLGELRSTAERWPAPRGSELDQRRLRNAVLQRANTLALRARPASAWSWRAAALLAATTGALASAAALVLPAAPAAPGAEPSVKPVPGVPRFELTASAGASWQTSERGPTLAIAVHHGRFAFAVDELRAGQRFLVELSDGELEAGGARFELAVERGQASAVRVEQGRVALRLRGRSARVLTAGEAWSAAAQAPALATSTLVAEQEQPAARVRTGPRARAEAATKLARATSSAVAPASPTAAGSAGRDFAAAMAAFSAGDYGRADRLFAAFARAHSADARAEDAWFLRAVAHARRGDLRASRAAAHEYLRRYPGGLRHTEAERLTR